jgi:hypothetical protein
MTVGTRRRRRAARFRRADSPFASDPDGPGPPALAVTGAVVADCVMAGLYRPSTRLIGCSLLTVIVAVTETWEVSGLGGPLTLVQA